MTALPCIAPGATGATANNAPPSLTRRSILGLVPAALGASILPAGAQPLDKPVKVIVGFPAGASLDTSARILAGGLRGVYADTILVDNRTGAGGRIAIDYVKNSPPDGTTILVTANVLFTIYPHSYSKLTYNLHRDFVPVAPFCSVGYSISVGPAVPESVRTVADYEKWVRANPKFMTFGSGSAGTTQHFIGVMLGRALKLPLEHVGYRGGAPMAQDLMGGSIAMGVQPIPDTIELVKAGRVRSLAVTTAQRVPQMPNVPTLAESGFSDMVLTDPFGVFVPIKTPPDIVRRLGSGIQTAVGSSDVQEKFQKMSFQPQVMAQAAYAQSLDRESEVWKQVVQASGFKADE